MKQICLFLFIAIFYSAVALALPQSEKLNVYVHSDGNHVELKWIVADYSATNQYAIYRNDELITTVAPCAYELLQQRGFDDDYIFMVHPFRDATTVDEQIMAQKGENKTAAFRILRAIRDNQFAENIGQYFLDSDVEQGAKYTYKIELQRNKKTMAEQSVTVVNGEDKTVNRVFSFQATSSAVGVSLNWGSGNTYSFYNIYRQKQGESSFSKITRDPIYRAASSAVVTRSVYEDNSLKKGEQASYYIRKIDMFGNEGEPSERVAGERLLRKTPARVENIFIKNSDGKITLRWQRVDNSLGYFVYRSLSYNGGYRKLTEKLLTTEAFFDTNFLSGKNYYYYVTAVNQHGESSSSTKMLAYARDVTPPPFPQNLTVEGSEGLVHLKWLAVSAGDLLGYRVYMSMDKDADTWSLVTKDAISGTSYLHTRPKTLSRHRYYYRVVAVDKAFNESAASNIVEVKLPDVTAPNQPKITNFKAYPSKIVLNWSVVRVYDLSHYNVYKKVGQTLIKLNDGPVIEPIFVDANPLVGVNEYCVTAVDQSQNESSRIQTIEVVAHDLQPVEIDTLMVARGANGVTIQFNCVDDDYSGFEVYRSGGSDKTYYKVSSFQTGMIFLDVSAADEITYFYMIKAFDRSGNIKESDVVALPLVQ